MVNRVLTVNPGSSNLKLAVVEGSETVAAVTQDDPRDVGAALAGFIESNGPVDAVAVRVVHGGSVFNRSVAVDEHVREELHKLVDLAPLHNPPATAALRSLAERMPSTPVVACFDTAFHSTMPQEVSTYAIPEQWRRRWDLRRFGFHGLSHAYVSHRAAQLLQREDDPLLRLVTCHLGAGASLAAVLGGVSVDTTMGFTPLEGLVMATRSGSIDPGVILWLMQHTDLGAAEIERCLEHDSGLMALAGNGDMRVVMAGAATGDKSCILARDVYLHRLCSLVGSMVATLGGMDGLVFTGGVGEGSFEIRQMAIQRLAFLGMDINQAVNRSYVGGDAVISSRESNVKALVIAAREDLQMAHEVRAILE